MTKSILFIRKAGAACAAAAFFMFGATSAVLAEPAVLPSAKAAAEVLRDADVAILGEVHDNAAHHQNQAEILRHLAPRAVVWEMITGAQAGGLTEALLGDAGATAAALDWEATGWPEFALYV